MKFLLLLVFFYVVKAQVLETGLTVSTGSDQIARIVGPVGSCSNIDSNKAKVSSYGSQYGIELIDNEEAVTNINNLVEPCSQGDYDCMRQFLANNSQCTPVYGPVPDPLYLAQTTVFFAFANMTLTYTNYNTTGLSNAQVSKFFYNKVTKDLVIVISISALTIKVPKLYVAYRRPGKESVIKSDEAYTAFKLLTFTAIIPKIGDLRLEFADIKYGYSGDGCPEIYLGPNFSNSTDPYVVGESAEFLANIPLAVRSFFVFQSQLYAAVYIQNFICNFNVELYSI